MNKSDIFVNSITSLIILGGSLLVSHALVARIVNEEQPDLGMITLALAVQGGMVLIGTFLVIQLMRDAFKEGEE